jgi:coenzyme F420 hydrogenase subunit beta
MASAQIIKSVIDNGFCIGCGNCAVAEPRNYVVSENDLGLIQALNIETSRGTEADKVCPFSNVEKNETYFNEKYLVDSLNYDVGIGHYRNVFAGFDNDEDSRLASSSGGLVSHLIAELFSQGEITGAIVVSSSEVDGGRLIYSIARSREDLMSSRKSKYNMVSHDEVIRGILNNPEGHMEKLVYVGIPCGVKAIKLLCEELPRLKEIIKYTVAIFCGHQKSHAFTEFVSWQLGVHPDSLKLINYRHKEKSDDASKYFYEVTGASRSVKGRVDEMKLMDWGIGLFKPKACDFCDDVAGEAADIIFGDAWQKKYAKDYRGTNLVITRSRKLEQILVASSKANKITLFDENKSLVYAAQGGNYRHRHEGLASRLLSYNDLGLWVPPKNNKRVVRYAVNKGRHELYISRHELSMRSHEAFRVARLKNDLKFFYSGIHQSLANYRRKGFSLKQEVIDFARKIKRLLSQS